MHILSSQITARFARQMFIMERHPLIYFKRKVLEPVMNDA